MSGNDARKAEIDPRTTPPCRRTFDGPRPRPRHKMHSRWTSKGPAQASSRESSAEPRGRGEKKEKKSKKKRDASSSKGSKKGDKKSKRSKSKGSEKDDDDPPADAIDAGPPPRETYQLPELCLAEDALRDEIDARDDLVRADRIGVEHAPIFASPTGFVISWLPDPTRADAWEPPPPPPLPKITLKPDGLPRLKDGLEQDRKGVERCWFLLRAHFEPFVLPTESEKQHSAEQKRDEAADKIHRVMRRFSKVRASTNAFSEKPRPKREAVVVDLTQPRHLPLADPGGVLKPRRAPLHRLFRFLERCGETFEGGYPYDASKWVPLQDLIRRTHARPRRKPPLDADDSRRAAAAPPRARLHGRPTSLAAAPTRLASSDDPRRGRGGAATRGRPPRRRIFS